jgi:hypothetical protein
MTFVALPARLVGAAPPRAAGCGDRGGDGGTAPPRTVCRESLGRSAELGAACSGRLKRFVARVDTPTKGSSWAQGFQGDFDGHRPHR